MTKASPDREDEHDGAAIAAKAAAIFGVLFTIAALGLYDSKVAFSVFVGAAIAVANLVMMRAIIRALIQAPEPADDEKPREPATSGIDDVEEMADRELAQEAQAKDAKTHREHVETGKKGGSAWGIFAVLKIIFLFGGIYILLTKGWVDPMPLAAGYGVLPLGIFASAAWGNLAPRRRRRR
jgi:hypothetical protein